MTANAPPFRLSRLSPVLRPVHAFLQAESAGGIVLIISAVAALLSARPVWLDELARRIGAPVALRSEPGLAISAGHVESRHA